MGDYRVEPKVLSERGGELTPDIIASGEGGWVVLELTLSGGSKEEKLEMYTQIDPKSLITYGLKCHETPPDVIASRIHRNEKGPVDGDFCQIIVKERFTSFSSNFIRNERLKNAIRKAEGQDLIELPSIPITLLPEMDASEIRRGVVGIVMKLFGKKDGMSAKEIAEEALERISERVSIEAKGKLITKIENQMKYLVDDVLKEYLMEKDGRYQPVEGFNPLPNVLVAIHKRLSQWVESTQLSLSDEYPPQNPRNAP